MALHANSIFSLRYNVFEQGACTTKLACNLRSSGLLLGQKSGFAVGENGVVRANFSQILAESGKNLRCAIAQDALEGAVDVKTDQQHDFSFQTCTQGSEAFVKFAQQHGWGTGRVEARF